MDLELKEFENKINNITEQFMSLLDSNEDIGGSVGNKFENTPKIFENKVNGPTVFNATSENFATISSYSDGANDYKNISTFRNDTGASVYGSGVGDINFGGITYGNTNSVYEDVPKHAVRFDSIEQKDLNQKLEGLYEAKKGKTSIFDEKPTIAFSDSNIGRINSIGSNSFYQDYTKDKENSTLNNKEVYEMASYNGEGNKENVFYSFATIPAERALVEKRDWKDVLFMDIPWDTKIDIWGGIKKFCTAQVKITFN